MPPNYRKYQEASQLTRYPGFLLFSEYSERFTPVTIRMLSLPQSTRPVSISLVRSHGFILDGSRPDYLRNSGLGWEEVVLEIKARIMKDTQLTCSIGIAPNKILAKLCTEVNKPNGYYRLPPTK